MYYRRIESFRHPQKHHSPESHLKVRYSVQGYFFNVHLSAENVVDNTYQSGEYGASYERVLFSAVGKQVCRGNVFQEKTEGLKIVLVE